MVKYAIKFLCVVIVGLVLAPRHAAGQPEKIDFNKARKLLQKTRRGEKLTKDEQQYLDQAKKLRRKRQRPNRANLKPPVGLQPLTDMSAEDQHKGQSGGLYGRGNNDPPEIHREAALNQARQIQALDDNGKPAEDGKIVLISVGMSNTTQEFSAFVREANMDAKKSPDVVIVDGAQGGMDAKDWSQPQTRFRKERPDPWTVLNERLQRAGVSPQQVQAAWIKQARRNPSALGEFPKHAEELKGHLAAIVNELKNRFPNLRIAYLSSRIYAGYARSALNPEPYAYESAFAVRWLIDDQITGDSALNYDPESGPVKAPLLLWGPYLWADGEKGRTIDDLVWKPEDFAADGTHPGNSGRRKVAALLLEFMKNDPRANVWFVNGKR